MKDLNTEGSGKLARGKATLQTHTDGHQHADNSRQRLRTYWAGNCIGIYSVSGFLLRWQLIEMLFVFVLKKKRKAIPQKGKKERIVKQK